MARRFGEIAVLRGSIIMMTCGFVLAVMAADVTMMLAAFFIAITGATACTPILNTITTFRTPPQMRGRMMGTTSSAASWGRVAGPLCSGAILQVLGYSIAWSFCVVVALTFMVWAMMQRPPTTAEEQQHA